MKLRLPENNKPRIEMLPLIDVVFLLLVVFIYTMLSMAVHKGMPVSLPESSVVKPEKDTVLSVTINKDNLIFVNKEPVDLEHLTHILEQKAKKEKTPDVLLFADKTISYQHLFKVLDRIRMAGLNQISLQADPEDQN
ncbi:MAG: biopolymer transporter ExbD [Desulfobacula sp.]|uniref:ExbD/TolR family protein n=1 Tax=Desulfobacula sp. TaxID=2593537 RepID=UPI0025BFD786|nr:biopolymer transporter ExbD [Desulfobacula sp.]MCD4721842.1 biopolymer transporter ExbD [Desulfobacula sp.]